MDDNDLDLRLHAAGESFRATHTQAVTPRARQRRRPVLLPLAAALVTASVIVGVALALPSEEKTPPVVAPPITLVPDMASVNDVEFNETWLAIAGGDTGQAARNRVEVRRRDNLTNVVATIQTSYPLGGPSCLALDGDTLLWTDFESIDSDYDPGPPTRWSLWERDLVTGDQRQLLSGKPKDAGPEPVPCAVTGQGWAAWAVDGKLTVRDLSTGFSYTRPDNATPVAITPSGLIAESFTGTGAQAFPRTSMQVVLRSGESYGDRRILATEPLGTEVSAGGDRLLVFAQDPAGETNDGALVSTCTLPACPRLAQVRNDPGSAIGELGDGFAIWSNQGESPAVLRFDGGAVPEFEPGYVPFHTLEAFGDTLVYGTQPNAEGPTTLHFLDVTGQ